jgi:SAM-dependent methyltransferase
VLRCVGRRASLPAWREWRPRRERVACAACGAEVRVDDVAIDFVPDRPPPAAWRDRAMQSAWLATLYDRAWRPASFGLSTGFGARSADDEGRRATRLLEGREGPWLDLSCGTGKLTRRFVEARGARGTGVFGLDVSRAMLARARVAAPGVVLVRADAADLPFDDGLFGAVATMAASISTRTPRASSAKWGACSRPAAGGSAPRSSRARGLLSSTGWRGPACAKRARCRSVVTSSPGQTRRDRRAKMAVLGRSAHSLLDDSRCRR